MALDLAKYHAIFLEESAEQLAEMSRALLELEKDPTRGEAVDLVFRMAHSLKGMAASLGYDSITEVAHVLEDRMEGIRGSARGPSGEELALLFRGLEGLESLVGVLRETGEPPPPDVELLAALENAESAPVAPKKKRQATTPPPNP